MPRSFAKPRVLLLLAPSASVGGAVAIRRRPGSGHEDLALLLDHVQHGVAVQHVRLAAHGEAVARREQDLALGREEAVVVDRAPCGSAAR